VPDLVFWFDGCVSRASVGRLGRPPVSVSAQSRTRILDAARLCFVDRGYDQTTMKDIAAAADMTAGALYHHFASKQELFAGVFRRHQGEALSAFEVAVAPGQSASDGFVEQLSAVLDVIANIQVGSGPTRTTTCPMLSPANIATRAAGAASRPSQTLVTALS
jgi:AcrR family transcriptional regulator